MGDKFLTLSEFNLEGNFLGFVGNKPKKIKYLSLAIPSGDVLVKLPKKLRGSLSSALEIGEQINIYGICKLNRYKGTIKLKAYQVTALAPTPNQSLPAPSSAKIMVCQKSGCVKRGGKGLLSELEKTLCDRGLLDKVTIEQTGCQKRCSSAPNCVLMLGKKKYKKIHPEAIASLLENYLTGDHPCHPEA
ncbi:(2Fe-2S) ferredoxin domain-containing protein [Anabaena subtropica]|uniref:(2Fe-2S) ferredoxin domain-containing protein n=1 Tax=Anabaena subtropica FACHB-260 TaxID=2692884 RepID=A0ABR8CL27_9NOST|nr:(2Fe-2S) ferredoxin domain-containing protein [Anabaena subtropica]MBD2343466.1 (2Fe-2S) ferredoxin domain-containing protein [Anabaena subtropica FACHB-260]